MRAARGRDKVNKFTRRFCCAPGSDQYPARRPAGFGRGFGGKIARHAVRHERPRQHDGRDPSGAGHPPVAPAAHRAGDGPVVSAERVFSTTASPP